MMTKSITPPPSLIFLFNLYSFFVYVESSFPSLPFLENCLELSTSLRASFFLKSQIGTLLLPLKPPCGTLIFLDGVLFLKCALCSVA